MSHRHGQAGPPRRSHTRTVNMRFAADDLRHIISHVWRLRYLKHYRLTRTNLLTLSQSIKWTISLERTNAVGDERMSHAIAALTKQNHKESFIFLLQDLQRQQPWTYARKLERGQRDDYEARPY